MTTTDNVRLRPLERDDLRFVHKLDNTESVMRYWFEEAYEAYVELCDLYDKHIHDQSERRFIIDPAHQGNGYARIATQLAMNYAFSVLNLYKIYLVVDSENKKAIHIYQKIGFQKEGELKHEFFINGQYRNAIRMFIFQSQFLPNFD